MTAVAVAIGRVITAVLVMLVVSAWPGAAQTGPAQAGPAQTGPARRPDTPPDARRMRVLLDGAKTPEQVPDSLIVEQVVHSLVLPPDADAEARRRRGGRLTLIGLSPVDVRTLEQALDARTPLLAEQFSRERQTWQDASPGMTATERTARGRQLAQAHQAFTMALYDGLVQTLTPDGAARLRAYVAREKRGIRVVSIPPDGR